MQAAALDGGSIAQQQEAFSLALARLSTHSDSIIGRHSAGSLAGSWRNVGIACGLSNEVRAGGLEAGVKVHGEVGARGAISGNSCGVVR